MNKGNKYMIEEDRYRLEGMLRAKIKKTEISEILGYSLKTIYNEIKRGTVEYMPNDWSVVKRYDAYAGQRIADDRAVVKGRPDKLSNNSPMLLKIENQIIEKKYSPEVALKMNQEEYGKNICLSTIYNYIEKKKFQKLRFYHLPTKRKKRNHHRRIKSKVAVHNVKGRSIVERPVEVDLREQFGHWEMDTVVGARGNGKSCLLVLTERKTRYELIFKIKDRTQQSVLKAMAKYEKKIGYKRFKDIFKTITCDNGVEFLNQSEIEKSAINGKQRTSVYYAHPFSSWERGSNENQNRMIRRWIKKGINMENIKEGTVNFIQKWLNEYPRKMFNYSSSEEMLLKEISFIL